MILKVKLHEKENQLEQFSNQLNFPVKNNQLDFENILGNIKASYYNFSNIQLYIYNFKLNQEYLFVSENNEDSGKYICSFNLSEYPLNKQVLNDELTDFKINGNDMLFYCPGISTSFKILPQVNYKIIIIAFEYKDIKQFILNESDIFLNKRFFIHRNIDSSINLKLAEIFQNNNNNIIGMIKLNSTVLEIMSICFKHLYSGDSLDNNFENSDIEAVYIIKNILENSIISECPKISELSVKAGMSQTKLKVIFKQVFGESIHQYYIKYKMQRAKELILKDKYSVSEISYKLGYKSTSHFISLFKKHFGKTPKDFALKNK